MMRDFLDYLWNSDASEGPLARWTARILGLLLLAGAIFAVVFDLLAVVLWVASAR